MGEVRRTEKTRRLQVRLIKVKSESPRSRRASRTRMDREEEMKDDGDGVAQFKLDQSYIFQILS